MSKITFNRTTFTNNKEVDIKKFKCSYCGFTYATLRNHSCKNQAQHVTGELIRSGEGIHYLTRRVM